MQIDKGAIYRQVAELTKTDRSTAECMSEVIASCRAQLAHSDWEGFRLLDYRDDSRRLKRWFEAAFGKDRPAEPIRGLWFGIAHPRDDSLDFNLTATSEYESDDPECDWVDSAFHEVAKRPYSIVLSEMHKLAHASDEALGEEAEIPLSFAYGAFAIRSLMIDAGISPVPRPLPPVGVAVGFDGGYRMLVGELRRTGLSRG